MLAQIDMRVRTFKPQFAPLVKAGSKRQTIRPFPKRMPKAGDPESWREWTGRPYNSPQQELAQVELTSVESVTIHHDGIETCPGTLRVCFWGEWHPVRRQFLNAVAILDGFKNWEAMRDYFQAEYGLPFSGILIKAKDLV